MQKREPVVLPLSILAGLAFLFAGIGGITALSGYPMVAAIAACGALAVASAQVGIQFWIRGQVTPIEDAGDLAVAERRDREAELENAIIDERN